MWISYDPQWSVADPGGRPGGPYPPLLGHDVGFLTLGPKLDPLLDPPLFACRPKMDPSGGSRVCVWQGWLPPPPLECGWRHTGNVQGGGGCLWMSKSGGVFQLFWGQMNGGWVLVKNPVSAPGPPPPFQKSWIRPWWLCRTNTLQFYVYI